MRSFLSTRFLIALFISFLLSVLAIIFIPRLEHSLLPDRESPTLFTFIGVGISIIVFTGFALLFGLNSSMRYPQKFILYTFLYNSLIVLAKFTLGQYSLYEVATERYVESYLGTINKNALSLTILAAVVFFLYFYVLNILYQNAKRRLSLLLKNAGGVSALTKKSVNKKFILNILLLTIIGIFIVTGGFFLLSAFAFISFFLTLEYVMFVFSTFPGLLAALCLIAAIFFASKSFKSVEEQASSVQNTTILTSTLWIGLSFLIMYHALWVVYLFILTTLWPLKFVTPK